MSENQISNLPHLPPPASDAPRKKPFILFSIFQWVVAAFFVLLALVLIGDLRKLGVPGAPVVLLWVALGTTAVVALGLSPPAFFRLPRIGKIGTYVVACVGFVMFGIYAGQMREAYFRTPQGAKEATAEAAADRQAANERAAETARLKAAEEARERERADKKLADLEAQKPGVCKILVDQMIAQTKSDGVQIIEVNNVTVEPGVDETHPLSCSGDAITSRGNMRVEFGLEHTPQGKDLLSFRFP